MKTKEKHTLIILEDEMAHAEAIRRSLSEFEEDCNIRIAASLAEFAGLISLPPDLVIADINLPDGSALTLLNEDIEKQPWPIIVMTSHGDEEMAVKAIKSGALDYIVKSPEAFNNIEHVVKRNLREWHNIQKRKESEKKFRVLFETLQQKNHELKKAKEKAEESDKFKSAFIANISHEIRTPMSGILGFAELLKMSDNSDENQATYVEAIIASGKRMLEIINDLINISRIEAGYVEVKTEPTDIYQLFDELYTFFSPDANKKEIELKINIELPKHKSLIETDKTKVSQVLTNLIKNAIKFTKVGFIEFGCKMKDDTCLFYVKDTGTGIKLEYQEVIFERFEQGKISTSEIQEGVGLGLAISKSYVQLLGGTIWLESSFSKGSVFYFTIPYNEPVNLNTPSKNKMDKVSEVSPIEVLIAEDEDLIYFFLNEFLKINKINTLHAKNGLEAVNAVKNNSKIKLILMDTRMPLMNGLEATRKIKKIRPDMPIIALSGLANDMDIQEASLAGCVDYITKPIDTNLLLKKIAVHAIF